MAKNNGMPLKLRPTGLGSEIDKKRQDYTVYIGKWAVGRIYDLRWFWSFFQHGPMMRSGRVSAFEEAKDWWKGRLSGAQAKAQFQRSWEAWKAWAKLEEAPLRHAGRTLNEFSSRGKPGP